MTTIAPNTASAVLKRLFDRQVAVLTTAGLAPEAELTALFPLLEKIGKVTEGEGRIPFVIVPQKPELTLAVRMEKVVLGGNAGASYLTDNRVTNLDNIPKGYYLAVDVEDGRGIRNTKPSVALAQFKRENRFGGTVAEGISVVTYNPGILRHHYIDLPGSHCGGGIVPYLGEGGAGPKLDAIWDAGAHPDYGALSCGGRLGLGA
jgi:hypothetical protein